MTSAEHKHYDQITEYMEADFLLLGDSFLTDVEEIIFGNDVEDFKYYCFHIYNDNYLNTTYTKLSYRIEKLIKQTDMDIYPNLFDGFSNLLIYLKEPILREQDQEYKAENYKYWLEVIRKDPDLVRISNAFRKYLTAM